MDEARTQIEPLLRACLRLRIDRTGRDSVVAALNDLSPDAGRHVVRRAKAERIGPLVHATVGDVLPPSAAGSLRERYYATATHNLLLGRQLASCLRALAAASVPAIVLKGAALLETVYENIALRPISDVDLLVRRADLTVARQVLERLGYQAPRLETHPGMLTEHESQMALPRDSAADARRPPARRVLRGCGSGRRARNPRRDVAVGYASA